MWNCAGRVHVLVSPVTIFCPRIAARVTVSVNVHEITASLTTTCTLLPCTDIASPSHTTEVSSHTDWPFSSAGAVSWIWYVPGASPAGEGSAGVGVFSATTFAVSVDCEVDVHPRDHERRGRGAADLDLVDGDPAGRRLRARLSGEDTHACRDDDNRNDCAHEREVRPNSGRHRASIVGDGRFGNFDLGRWPGKARMPAN